MKPAAAKEKSRSSGHARSYLQTRIRASRLQNAARILAFIELSRRLHQAYRQAYDKSASGQLLPQNSPVDSAKKALSQSSCSEFYKRVLNSPNVNTKGNPVLEGGDLSKIFQDFLDQKKGGLTRTRPEGSAGYGSPTGLIRPGNKNSNGAIYLPAGQGDYADAVGLVGEIFHLAGSKGYYYDYELAVAVHNIPEYASKFPLKAKDNIFDPSYGRKAQVKDKYDNGYSTYFHNIERIFCPVEK
ncbi:MAG TPA: hypothetical protein VE961_22170 [Pyrinomonadaceae bacterium]|nr:hypothetical protein [Pyrinomonadaceae bacterium]